jgi:hypothetical protein
VKMGTDKTSGHRALYTDSETDPCKGYLNVQCWTGVDGVTLNYGGYHTNMTPDGNSIPRKPNDKRIPGIARSDLKYN